MQKKNHIMFGIVLAAVFILFLGYLKIDWFIFNFNSVSIIMGLTVFYSILPDIDHKNSTITWWFFGIGILGLLFGVIGLIFGANHELPVKIIVLSTLFLVFTFISANIFEHRGIIHSIPVGLLSVVPVFFIFNNFAYCAIAYVAWHSHLIGDGYIFKIR